MRMDQKHLLTQDPEVLWPQLKTSKMLVLAGSPGSEEGGRQGRVKPVLLFQVWRFGMEQGCKGAEGSQGESTWEPGPRDT